MPQVIAVLNPKGGSGKTTLATNLARALELDTGEPVLIVDTDLQGTARDWDAARGEDGIGPPVVGLSNAPTLTREIQRMGSAYAFVVVDGAAKAEVLSGAAVRAADVVLIPVQPSPADIWGAADLVGTIEATRMATGGRPAAAFVVSRQTVGTRLATEIEGALADYGLPVLAARTSQRVAYPEALMTGSTVLDTDPHGAAAAEVRAIAAEVRAMLATQGKPDRLRRGR